ncbi:MAG: NAD(+) kinase [Gammaproteobacteria bacterium]|nr:MAG: NAD(+) kinase [Gammaproteobacteria bacterium]
MSQSPSPGHSRFETIGLIWKNSDPEVLQSLHEVVEVLRGYSIRLLAAEQHDLFSAGEVSTLPEMARQADLIIPVGGDGTFIQTARHLSAFSGKLIGVNQGHLGFLADIQPDSIEATLNPVIQGQYLEEERFLLEAKVIRNGKTLFECKALNDVVVHKWSHIRMLQLETYVNGVFVHHYRSDGQIVSTPTGSTAYALSAGGPILYPTMDAMVLVPICPHRLSHRAITISSDSKIDIKVCGKTPVNARVTCDGQDDFELCKNDIVKIRKSPHTLTILHPEGHDHFHLLRDKLGWG